MKGTSADYSELIPVPILQMLNSNLLEVLARAQLELAVLYVGNPCQMTLAHVLSIPFVLIDLEGLNDETLIAAEVFHDKLAKLTS